jgi:thioredoxin-dependent peroxiredoxin
MPNTALKVGDRAPLFTLPNQAGVTVNLADLIGQKPIVLYFYPKDDTPGCTAESCAFRDSYEQFQDLGAEVIGISADPPTTHQQFVSKYQLPFTLLSDVSNQVRERYGVPPTFFVVPGRVTYVIDREGIVRHIFDSQFNFNGHVEEALKILKQL